MDQPRSASTVAKWESDDRSPDSDQLREICRVLHVSADVLLERAPFELGPMPAKELP
jgi:transcriptional regulator with XRE-family HTH domain